MSDRASSAWSPRCLLRCPEFATGPLPPSTAELHFDEYDNIALVLAGPKTFLLLPPDAIHPRAAPVGSRVSPHSHPGVDPLSNTTLQHKWLRATLRAGDVLVLPKYWLHWVISAPWSIMTNKWLDTRAAIVSLRCHPDCSGLFLANITDPAVLSELNNSFSAFFNTALGPAARTRSHHHPFLSPATGLEGVFESTFVAHPGVYPKLRDANITSSPPPLDVWHSIEMLLPTVRQMACLINRSLCLWSVTFVYTSPDVSRLPHVDPGSYELVVSVTVGGKGFARFTTLTNRPITTNLRASAGDVIAFTGFARWGARHCFAATSSTARSSIIFRFGPDPGQPTSQ